MSSEVRQILDRIMELSEAQQEELRAELARRDEVQWRKLSAGVRARAKQQGVDDAAIARAVEEHRYGPNRGGA